MLRSMTKFTSRGRRYLVALITGLFLSANSPALAEQKLSPVLDEQSKTVTQNKKSQEKIDELAEQKSTLLDQYKMVLAETESLRAYNDQMQKLIDSQLAEADSMARQIEQIEVTNKEVVPLMLRMIESLDDFVKLDVPFLEKERTKRIASLREMMNQANVSTSEKFRRVMEAFQVENEYGRTTEAYRDDILSSTGSSTTVDFLRIGRVVLIYQTLDGKEAKIWNNADRKWVELPDTYRKAITEGLKMARKQAAPDLLVLPVNAPESAEGA